MEKSTSPHKVFIERDRSGLFGLHVSNIPPDLNENDLRDLFITSGFIKVCKIIKTADNRVAFVKFTSYDEAAIALKKCNGTKISGHILDVRPAYESKNYRHHKEKSSESLTKHDVRNQHSAGVQNGAPTSESKKTDQREERDAGDTVKDVASKSPAQAPRTYILPASSQDIRYSSSGRSNSSESISEPKDPVNPSNFNKLPAAKDTPKHTGLAASFDRCKLSDSTLQSIPSKPKMDGSNKAKENPVSSVTHLAKNSEKSHLDNSFKRGQHAQHQKSSLDQSHQRNQCSQQPKNSKNSGHSNSDCSQERLHISKWSVDEVAEYYESQEESSDAMVSFIKEQEIDGNALMLIEQSSLLYFMKLGPVLKFLNIRENLKN